MVTRRRVLSLGLAAASLALAGGCASGTSREAERGRERDAERTSIVDDMQATNTARLVTGTPPATPGNE